MKTLISAVIAALMLPACSSSEPIPPSGQTQTSSETPKTQPHNLAAKWYIQSFGKFSEKDFAAKNAFLDLSRMPKAYGNMGCNDLMFQARTVGPDKIDFGAVAGTMMLCENMGPEDTFSRMKSVWNYRFEGDDLILEQDGTLMRLRRK